jgi:hypothetical protein
MMSFETITVVLKRCEKERIIYLDRLRDEKRVCDEAVQKLTL